MLTRFRSSTTAARHPCIRACSHLSFAPLFRAAAFLLFLLRFLLIFSLCVTFFFVSSACLVSFSFVFFCRRPECCALIPAVCTPFSLLVLLFTPCYAAPSDTRCPTPPGLAALRCLPYSLALPRRQQGRLLEHRVLCHVYYISASPLSWAEFKRGTLRHAARQRATLPSLCFAVKRDLSKLQPRRRQRASPPPSSLPLRPRPPRLLSSSSFCLVLTSHHSFTRPNTYRNGSPSSRIRVQADSSSCIRLTVPCRVLHRIPSLLPSFSLVSVCDCACVSSCGALLPRARHSPSSFPFFIWLSLTSPPEPVACVACRRSVIEVPPVFRLPSVIAPRLPTPPRTSSTLLFQARTQRPPHCVCVCDSVVACVHHLSPIFCPLSHLYLGLYLSSEG